MLSVDCIVVGKIKEKWMTDGIKEYAKRLTAYCRFNIIEISEHRLPENPSEKEILVGLEKEGREILGKIGERTKVIALCIEGKQLSSLDLSELLENYSAQSSKIVMIIGSSFGLSDSVKNRADLKLSMSPMTFPHQLVRVMAVEQLYRALSISGGSKYHK